MNSVSIKLQGGLCNYLFQIAAAYAYSLKYNKKLILSENDSVVIHKHLSSYKTNILRNVEFVSNVDYSRFKVYNEQGFHYTEIPELDGDIYLIGYYQSAKYWQGYEKEIRELFSFPQEMIDAMKEKYKEILSKETCSIHVRRGDFVSQQQYHPVQTMNYYMKGIKQVGINKTYLCFSDDIQWCKESFSMLPDCHFIENQPDYLDLLLMSLTNHNVIANSTFSWFGTYLNNNAGKVIAPKTWFGEAYKDFNTTDLYCENWIKI